MNETLVAASAIAAISIAMIGFVVYKIRTPINTSSNNTSNNSLSQNDDSSLEEDFRDILEFVPLIETRNIINSYAKHDIQIADTISFINDQKRFIIRELRQIPEVMNFIDFLWQNGLAIESWNESINTLWKALPRFAGPDESAASGGLSVMISKIFNIVPSDELHEHLCQKMKYSKSFKKFVMFLKSDDFGKLCDAIQKSDILSQHIFWAEECGIEVMFAIKLLRHSHNYLTGFVI